MKAAASDMKRIDDEKMTEWFFRNRAWFFGIMFFLPGLSIVEELVRSGHMASVVNIGFLPAFEVVIAFAFFVKSRRAQEWICGQAMVLTLLYVAPLYLGLG